MDPVIPVSYAIVAIPIRETTAGRFFGELEDLRLWPLASALPSVPIFLLTHLLHKCTNRSPQNPLDLDCSPLLLSGTNPKLVEAAGQALLSLVVHFLF
jgi:hypothetical protein